MKTDRASCRWALPALLGASMLCGSVHAQQGMEYGYDDLRRLISVTYPSGMSILYAYDENGNRTLQAAVQLPTAPTAPSPADGAEDVPVDTAFSWSAVAAADSYDLYLWKDDGTRDVAPTVDGLADPTYQPPEVLEALTTYYRKVVARNQQGVADGPEWTFTTGVPPPGSPTNPDPPDGATDVSVSASLSWETEESSDVCDLYLWQGDEAKPETPTAADITLPAYEPPELLEDGLDYLWQIVVRNEDGSTEGPVWTFTTEGAPEPPTDPEPANGATDVAVEVGLSWEIEDGSDVCDLYLWWEDGPRPETPTAADLSAPAYDPPEVLAEGLVYWWQVVVRNAAGSTEGPVWTFTTERGLEPPGPPTDPEPADGATRVSLRAGFYWHIEDASAVCDLYLWKAGARRPGTPIRADLPAGSYMPSNALEGDTIYLWQVMVKNDGGSTEGAVWTFTTEEAEPGPGSLGSRGTSAAPTCGACGAGASAMLVISGCVLGFVRLRRRSRR